MASLKNIKFKNRTNAEILVQRVTCEPPDYFDLKRDSILPNAASINVFTLDNQVSKTSASTGNYLLN